MRRLVMLAVCFALAFGAAAQAVGFELRQFLEPYGLIVSDASNADGSGFTWCALQGDDGDELTCCDGNAVLRAVDNPAVNNNPSSDISNVRTAFLAFCEAFDFDAFAMDCDAGQIVYSVDTPALGRLFEHMPDFRPDDSYHDKSEFIDAAKAALYAGVKSPDTEEKSAGMSVSGGKTPQSASIAALVILAAVILWIRRGMRKARKRKRSAKPLAQADTQNRTASARVEPAYTAPRILDNDPEIETFADYGFYKPVYKFADASQYSDKLKNIRQRQKQMVQDRIACTFPRDMTYNGDKRQGAALINDWMKLMLRAFNGECDAIIMKARADNVTALSQRIKKSADTINTIGKRMNVQITQTYVELKIDELQVSYEYEVFKAEEKERLRQIREEEREKAKVEKELKEKMDKLEKDLQHIQNERNALQARLDAAGENDDITALQFELDKLDVRSQELEAEKEDIAEREVNSRAGYVYIISNIGSFGENVYKIGMTRRIEPQERIDELGSASVPFTFDVHAFIFSTDAVSLETALHRRFDEQRVNLVNPRKEFFAVTLDEIEAEVKRNYNGTTEFRRTAAAEEYRESLEIRKYRQLAQR